MKRYGKVDYTGSYMERWDIDGKMRGDCDEYAAEAYMRAKAKGLPVVKQRFRCFKMGENPTGHIAVRMGKYIIHNQSMWVETMAELRARGCWPR